MTPERWQEIKEVLAGAMEVATPDRAAYLDRHCAGDSALRCEVERLLQHERAAGSGFLNQSALAHAALATLPDQGSSWTGRRVGVYQVREQIGAGGMGEVYRARDTSLKRDVAIKVLPASYSRDPGRLRRFELEAQAAAALSHPNVIAIFSVGQYDGEPYIVTELLEGETLRDHMCRGPMRLSETLDLAVAMARGLAAAHEKGIVHRDLKPENVFLATGGRLKILDFGLAKLVQEQLSDSDSPTDLNPDQSRTGQMAGTIGYMSPEQIRHLPADVRSDIFALGLVLYEMLTGRRAFRQQTPAETTNAILDKDPPEISKVLPDIPPALALTVNRCLEKAPERRFQSALDLANALDSVSKLDTPPGSVPKKRLGRLSWKIVVPVAAVIVTALIAGVLYNRSRTSPQLTEADTIVLADFANSTGDPVFDDTLKQGLATDLQQSPFFNILPQRKVRDTLKLMGRATEERLTASVAQEVCQRTESKVVVEGSISTLGSHYVIALNAVNCQTGDSLVREQAEAGTREDVLNALDHAANQLRGKVGESLSSIQNYDTPLKQATTPSLDALKAYSMGNTIVDSGDPGTALPLYKRAIELDPDFAAAYTSLGIAYFSTGESGLASESLQRAYALRDRVSERERLIITTFYHKYVTGDLYKASQASELLVRTYPREFQPHGNLGNIYGLLGEYQKALAEQREAIRLNPDSANIYVSLVFDLMHLERFAEAKGAFEQGLGRKLDPPAFHYQRYAIAFLEGDATEMKREVAWSVARLGADNMLLNAEANTEAFSGHMQKARELHRLAAESALRAGQKEVAAGREMLAAFPEAEFGNAAQARRETAAALALAPTRNVRSLAAFVLARAGDSDRARKMADDLEKQDPFNTEVVGYWLPTIRAAIEINRKNPAKAIEILQTAAPLELGERGQLGVLLYPIYVRGQAYLALQQGSAAAAEFQKLIDHRGLVLNQPIGALARLGLARAHALQGDTVKASTAYQDFLTLWKDADPEIPVLKKAQAEYARLQ